MLQPLRNRTHGSSGRCSPVRCWGCAGFAALIAVGATCARAEPQGGPAYAATPPATTISDSEPNSIVILRQELVTITADALAAEEQLTRLEERLASLIRQELDASGRLSARRQELSHVLAAMQRLSGTPMASLLATPGEIDQAAQAGALLKSLYDDLRRRSAELRVEIAELRQLRVDIDHAREAAQTARLTLDRKREAIEERIAARQTVTRALDGELGAAGERAAEISATVGSVPALVDELDAEADARAERRAEVAMVVPKPRPDPPDPATFAAMPPPIPTRLSADAFERGRVHLRLPAAGEVAERYGDTKSGGAKAKGITVKARAGAHVIAPIDGEVLFAAPYRSYGMLVIISPAEGTHVLVSGLGQVTADVGQWLLAGEPIGRAPAAAADRAKKDVGVQADSQPIYIELRRNGKSVDPTPWLRPDSRKVTGS